MTNSIGNVVSRLQGLKNVRPRRVLPGAEFLQELEPVETDVSGTAQELPNFANLMPKNEPQEDLGGSITSQSYDVRANTAQPPEQSQNDPGFFSKLGQALGSFVNPQAQRKSRLMENLVKEKIPEVPREPVESVIPSAISNLGSSLKSAYESPNLIRNIAEEAFVPDVLKPAFDYAFPPQEIQPSQANLERKNTEFQERINQAMQQPWQQSVYGSAQEVSNSPVLQAEFKKYTGIDYEPQIAQQVSSYEEAMKGVEDALNGINDQLSPLADGIKQRILNNQSTDNDKLYIGLALLMPLLIGGIFGKEAGLGALGGGAQGIADILAGRQKNIQADEASLLDINKQQAGNQEKLANLQLERAKLEPSLRKNLPDQPEKQLIGMDYIDVVNPETGKQERGFRLAPGLVANDQYLSTPEGKANMIKAANELSEVKNYTDEINDLTGDVIKIVSQLDDSGKKQFYNGFVSLIKDKVPGNLSVLSQDVELNGRKVNAGIELEGLLGLLTNAYGHAKDLGQTDKAMQSHVKRILENPTASLLTPEDSINQMINVRNLAQKGLIQSAKNRGFYPEFLMQDLQQNNEEVLGGLNQRENDKKLQQRKKQALQNETNYAI